MSTLTSSGMQGIKEHQLWLSQHVRSSQSTCMDGWEFGCFCGAVHLTVCNATCAMRPAVLANSLGGGGAIKTVRCHQSGPKELLQTERPHRITSPVGASNNHSPFYRRLYNYQLSCCGLFEVSYTVLVQGIFIHKNGNPLLKTPS